VKGITTDGPTPNYKRDKRSPIPKNATVSKVMSRIKSSNTKPEVAFRKMLSSNGIRGYRINYKKLPGKPDIVFTRKKLAIFINGCYWHGCETCGWKPPKHNTEYWVSKIQKNKIRDADKRAALTLLGYTVIVVWEHDLKTKMDRLAEQMISTLSS